MIAHDEAPEHEFEAAPGLPEPLPRGERILWQGSPEWRALAREAMHVRGLSLYFVLLLLWRGTTTYADGASLLESVGAALWLTPLALAALAMLALIAWFVSRTTLYTITDRRVVMRVGIVLTITFNLPFSRIEAAGLRTFTDGSGDLTLQLDQSDRIAYLHLWPHVRPWQVRRTQPMLRAIPQARRVSDLLSAALSDAAGVARPVPGAGRNEQTGRQAPQGAGASRRPLTA